MTDDIPAIEINHLSHWFKRHNALKDVNFVVRKGSLHGFVGPNGAGKTTALKLICTLLVPQYGYIRVFGSDVVHDTHAVRRGIGFMPDHFSMYRQMTVFEYLDFFGAAYGLAIADRNRVIQDVLELTDMTGRQHSLISGLSRGMQQRVSLARVLINDPALLLLDEPASGLDPRARIELMDILRALQGMGKTVFISSHILSELAELCDSVTIIDRGQIKFTGPMDELLESDQTEEAYLVTFSDPPEDIASQLEALPGVRQVETLDGKPEYRIVLDSEVSSNQLINALIQSELTIRAINPGTQALESGIHGPHAKEALLDVARCLCPINTILAH